MPDAPDWSGEGKATDKSAKSSPKATVQEKPYVYVPGTTHLNAFLADVEDKKQLVYQAQSELAAAEERLHQKKVESGMISA